MSMNLREVIIIGAGLAGLSAAVYLGRSKRDTLLIDSGHSMARWEPDVQNYLGFPDGISGEQLLEQGYAQAARYRVQLIKDDIRSARLEDDGFHLEGRAHPYQAKRVVLATGITHVPPDIPEVKACLGRSLFFCKDCNGYRVQGGRIGVIGQNNEAAEYALAMLDYSPFVILATNGREEMWDKTHDLWLQEYHIPVYEEQILEVEHDHGQIRTLGFKNGDRVAIQYLFAARGDVYHNQLAHELGAACDPGGQIRVDSDMRTSVKGLYAAGCVTPANCQMIIAAGQGATAAQAVNRDLFEESLRNHSLRRHAGSPVLD
jgi:thioredoxin reductase (NADPH)